MAKISHEQILQEVNNKGFILLDDSKYQNLQSPITVRCLKGHDIETTLASVRHTSFVCPICDGAGKYEPKADVPAKGNYRVVAFDQATEKMGISVWDDGKLTFCKLFSFSGDLATRLCKIRDFIENTIIKEWKPDFMVFEDIQYQNNILTFKILAMLLGICEVAARKNGIEYDTVAPKVWRSGIGYSGKNRAEEKKLAIERVKDFFGITVSEDVAEAILIGKYATRFHKAAKLF